MISISILGCDSTHTRIFGDILRAEESNLGAPVRLNALWGENPDQAYQIAKTIGLDRNAPTIEHALEGADLALVLGRFGDSHIVPARIALNHGVATFVDKPFTSNVADAIELIEQARRTNVMLTSASALRFANELRSIPREPGNSPVFLTAVAPANCTDLGNDPRLNSVFFYGIHALEMVLQVMGSSITKFSVASNLTSISANMQFENGEAVLHLIRDIDEFYEISWYQKSRHKNIGIALDGTYNFNLLKMLLSSFVQNRPLVGHNNTLNAIKVLSAMEHIDISTRKTP